MTPIKKPRPTNVWLTEEFQTRLPGLPVPPVVEVAIVPVSIDTAGVVEVALEPLPSSSVTLTKSSLLKIDGAA